MLQLTDKDARVATMKWAKIQGREHRKMSMKGEEETLRDERCVHRKDIRIHMAWSQKGEQFMKENDMKNRNGNGSTWRQEGD